MAHGRPLAIGLAILFVALRVEDPTLLRSIRFQTLDLMQQASPSEPTQRAVAVVDIDEASIAELGQWPWDRKRLATLVDRLREAGARAIGFDIVFSEPDRLSPTTYADHGIDLPPVLRGALSSLDDTDAAFAAAIARAPVVLGASGVSARQQAGRAPPPTTARVAPFAEYGGDPRPYLFGFPSMLANIDALEAAAAGHGLFSLTPEHDGVVRRPPAALRVGDTLFPSLALEMLRVAAGASHHAIRLNQSGAGVEALRVQDIEIPTDSNGRIWLRFAPHQPDLYIPARDVLAADFDPARVAGKLVLVGTSAVGLRDLRMTPLGQSVPGVEVHAGVIEAALGGAGFLKRPSWGLGVEHLAALAGGLLIIILAPRLNAARGLPLFLGLIAAYWGGAWFAFDRFDLALDATYPSLLLTAAFAAVVYGNYSRTDAQRRRIREAFSHYLAPALVERLSERADSLSLGGESRELTFLFSDVADFTKFVERTDPEDLVEILNAYLDGVCRIVTESGGAIDKIVGDAVHAMFNAPLDDPNHAENAVACALKIEAFVEDYRAGLREKGFDFGVTRIGVNTGRAIVGNFGGSRRFDYTAHGDAINVAARLEGANKHLGTTIIVSESAARLCRDIAFRPIGQLYLVGKDAPVGAFEPVRDGAEAEAAPYETAFRLLEQNSIEAPNLFRQLAERHPQDPLVALHWRRLREGAHGVDIVMGGK